MNSQTDYTNYIIFNPEGKIKQLEFINNTVQLGSTVVALKNKSFGVFVTYNEKRSKFALQQKKIFPINSKSLFSFSGITNDGTKIVKYLKNSTVFENIRKGRDIHPIHVFDDLCYSACIRTLTNGNRLYGVQGLLLTDYQGISLVLFDPKGSAKEVRGMSIGSRSQSCRTILEDECDKFEEYNKEELVRLGIKALRNAYPETGVLNKDNVDIWILETNQESKQIKSEEYLQ
ncbi:proteasome subunit PSA6 (PSA6) [Vairimorpha necatrix]|uniref:Proteasome subunit PSA6 (PSA6) n=1 Tax=Vairimorpha necatrix TaxID=6039 RepID=A0AAX4J8B6_9MICR|nr:Chain E, Proteasome subunit alpha type-6 [Vairimorpha necatrix]8ADN_S Chain S, Proteasome subunit alpha type-6 [Vairimorpha necatrix]